MEKKKTPNQSKNQNQNQYTNIRTYTGLAGNLKEGTHKTGNKYFQVGMVVKQGKDEGKWFNLWLTRTELTKERIKRDFETLGITDWDPFTTTRQMVTFTVGTDASGYEKVISVKKLNVAADGGAPNLPDSSDELPF